MARPAESCAGSSWKPAGSGATSPSTCTVFRENPPPPYRRFEIFVPRGGPGASTAVAAGRDHRWLGGQAAEEGARGGRPPWADP